ncbi:MAG: lysoplasmalogenase family protein [Clostridiales bacterium]|nr:lysoplasmalogenase family protein [Clostridiales bacterium]
MPETIYLLAPVFAYCQVLAAFSVIVDGGAPKLKLIFKSVASASFIVGGALFMRYSTSEYSKYIMLSLVFGAAGDVLLALHVFFADKKKKLVLNAAGGLAFAAGHAIYMLMFFASARFNAAFLPLPAIFALVPLLAKKRIVSAFGKKAVLPLCAYSLILGLLIAAAASLLSSAPTAKNAVMLAAAVVFAVSDFLLVSRMLGVGKEKAMFHAAMITYYTAQWAFALSIALL